ncbi:GroES-like protein [Ophiobolus disseminans]|uniref:GroES-like protein n=1 Tax=Ophiobolus disseminans TaxID=1469910 RepID=A0A6A6ZEP1_9PLEO|nr:GroES-like protein [Ophiobolus disseminans]
MSNKAAWITKPKGNPLEVKEAPMPKAGKGEVVIKNHAIAVNPVDWKVQDYGIILQKYPNVLGTDVAGEVYEVGEDVTHLKKGDRVLGHAFSLITNDPSYGGFQLYTACNALVVSKIPASLDFNSAAVLPLAISTAAACLFKKEALALPLPKTGTKPNSSGKSVLIWGGSSSMGAAAIQLAVGAGLKVVTVASKHNTDKVKNLGASAVIDYKSSSAVDDIVAALDGTDFAGVCDCIGAAEAWAPVYKKIGGRYGSVLPGDQVPGGIEGAAVFAPSVAFDDRFIGETVWAKWVPESLENGALRALPGPIVIEGGLDAVQKGCDEQKKGVSFAKIVVAL